VRAGHGEETTYTLVRADDGTSSVLGTPAPAAELRAVDLRHQRAVFSRDTETGSRLLPRLPAVRSTDLRSRSTRFHRSTTANVLTCTRDVGSHSSDPGGPIEQASAALRPSMFSPFRRWPCHDELNVRPPLVRLWSRVHGGSSCAWGFQRAAQTRRVHPCRRTRSATIPKDTPPQSKTSNSRMQISRSALRM